MNLVFIEFDITMQPRHFFFSENGNLFSKMTKNTFLLCFLAYISFPLLVLIAFALNFGTFLTFWGDPEI